MGYKIDADNVFEEYGGLLDFHVNGHSVPVISFDPVKGEIEMRVDIGGCGFLDAYNDVVTVKFVPMVMDVYYKSTGALAYKRDLSSRPITA